MVEEGKLFGKESEDLALRESEGRGFANLKNDAQTSESCKMRSLGDFDNFRS